MSFVCGLEGVESSARLGDGLSSYAILFLRKANKHLPISTMVWQIGGLLRSGNARGRIYGLLGVQDPGRKINFPIDYGKPVEDVYINSTRKCIEHNVDLRVLECHKRNSASPILGLPSWVPDWTARPSIAYFTRR